jgi:hypothetical protein
VLVADSLVELLRVNSFGQEAETAIQRLYTNKLRFGSVDQVYVCLAQWRGVVAIKL